jgi:hypothetical protein
MALMAHIEQIKLVVNIAPSAVGDVVRLRSLSQSAPLALAK